MSLYRFNGRPKLRGILGRVAVGLFGELAFGYALLFTLVAGGVAFTQRMNPLPIRFYLVRINAISAIVTAAPVLIFVLAVTVQLMKKGRARPTRTLARIIYRERFWLARCVLLFFCFLTFSRTFGAMKPMIPKIVPFYADPTLAKIDSLLFFGTDPWRLTHAVFGGWGTIALDRIYMLFFVALGVFNIWILMSRDKVMQLRALLTEFGIWFLLGTVMALGFSSTGPVFYEQYYGDPRFAPLMAELLEVHSATRLNAVIIAQWLSESSAMGDFGSGISAMPSIHIAQTYMFLILTRYRFGSRWPTWVMAMFFALMWIGSVHLGWHYFVDGLVSVLMVTIMWRASGLVVERKYPSSLYSNTSVSPPADQWH